MSLKNPVAPKRMLIALKQALPSLYQFLQENPHVGVNHRDIQKARVKLWLPVYIGSVTLPKSKKKRVDARPRLSAKRVAWLCFLKTRNGVNVGVELKTDKSRAVHHQFQQGEPIHNTFARLRTASRNPRLLRAVYTGRLHSMPGLYFSALWFKSPSREIFASLVRVGKELKAGGLYTRTEVVAVLKDELSRRKEAHQIILARVIRPRREQEPRQWLSSALLNSYPITSEATPHTVFKPPAQERSPSFHLPVDISTAEGSNYRICLKASRTDALRQGDSGFFRLTIDFQFH